MAQAPQGQITCSHCGRVYKWKPEIAGRKVVCKCGQKMRIPAEPSDQVQSSGSSSSPAQEPSTYELAASESHPSSGGGGGSGRSRGSRQEKCPTCNQALKPGAVICINCGYNLQEGKRLKTQVGGEADAVSGPGAAVGTAAVSPALAAASTGSALAEGWEQEEENANRMVDLWLPLGLIVLGVAVQLLQTLYFSSHPLDGIVAALIALGVRVFFSVVMLFLGILVAARALDIAFGPLGAALFKLVAIVLGPAAIGAIVSYFLVGPLDSALAAEFVGMFISFIIYWILLSVLFDLEGLDVFWVIIIVAVVQYVANLVAGIVLVSLII